MQVEGKNGQIWRLRGSNVAGTGEIPARKSPVQGGVEWIRRSAKKNHIHRADPPAVTRNRCEIAKNRSLARLGSGGRPAARRPEILARLACRPVGRRGTEELAGLPAQNPAGWLAANPPGYRSLPSSREL